MNDIITSHPTRPHADTGIEGGDPCVHRFHAPGPTDAHRRNVRGLDRHLCLADAPTEPGEPIDWTQTALSWEQREHQGCAA
ncbi:hypothetical protein ACQEVZ_24820 [Dactylosporangium sp. CA-152071]|uniref:hypothetical protein n=1 Tax=Dactylosporangium sp. CA-152071 TaxID=3239933 RepID=UPI003D8E365B